MHANNVNQTVHWMEGGEPRSARWQSEAGLPPPVHVEVVDDTLTADTACRLAHAGKALLWRGDFQNARQLLQAMARRLDRKKPAANLKGSAVAAHETEVREKFHRHRAALAQRASVLGKLLVPLNDGFAIPLRRAPDVAAACREVFGTSPGPMLLSLRELQGVIGAHEWRKKGVAIDVLSARIYPHYGVFSPVRGEYLQLVASVPLPAAALGPGACAFDIGTGTGVIAAVLAKRGIADVTATDLDARALACARANIDRLGLSAQVRVEHHHLFPPGRASLIVCNPPWVPAKPSSPVESAVFDPDSQMLRGFLNGLCEHLESDGEGWLILSDLAEHLGLRSRQTLLAMIASAGLTVAGRHDIRPAHPKVRDASDPLHAARAQEVTSLWRLKHDPA